MQIMEQVSGETLEIAARYSERRIEERLSDVLTSYRSFTSAAWEPYEFFGLDEGMNDENAVRTEQKRQFLSGAIKNPNLNYPKLKTDAFIREHEIAEQGIMALGSQLDELTTESDRITVAQELPAQRHLELMLLDISGRFARKEVAEEDRQAYVELFNSVNDELYGAVDIARFAGLLQPVRRQALLVLSSPEPIAVVVREAAEYVLLNTGVESDTVLAEPPLVIDDDTRQQVREMFERYFAKPLSVIPSKARGEKLTSQEFAQMFRDAHALLDTGWGVATEPGKSTMDTRQSTRMTVIGDERPLPDEAGARGIFAHEFCIHVLRRYFGDQLGDPLLAGTGLAGYVPNEEGAGRIVQQVMDGKDKVPGSNYYITLGLARGKDGDRMRDFRGVFELEWRRRLLEKYATNPMLPHDAVSKAKNAAYTTCLRIFRGTPCDEPGMVFAKDIGYYDGGQNMWPYFIEIAQLPLEEQKARLDEFLTAKHDPLHPVQTRVVKKALARAAIDKTVEK